MTLLIGGWLIVSLSHDDSLCSRQGVMLTQLDAVSRADFTSRHLFQVGAQTRYNTQFLHSGFLHYLHAHYAAEGKTCAVARQPYPGPT
jgi:hypothetical protein